VNSIFNSILNSNPCLYTELKPPTLSLTRTLISILDSNRQLYPQLNISTSSSTQTLFLNSKPHSIYPQVELSYLDHYLSTLKASLAKASPCTSAKC